MHTQAQFCSVMLKSACDVLGTLRPVPQTCPFVSLCVRDICPVHLYWPGLSFPLLGSVPVFVLPWCI